MAFRQKNINIQVETTEGTSLNFHKRDENGKMYGSIPYKGTTAQLTIFIDENNYLIKTLEDPFTGEISKTIINEKDEVVRKKAYYPCGKLGIDIPHKNNVADGWVNFYKENGNIEAKFLFRQEIVIEAYLFDRFGAKIKMYPKEIKEFNKAIIKKKKKEKNNEYRNE